MKKYACLTLVVLLVFTLVGCGTENTREANSAISEAIPYPKKETRDILTSYAVGNDDLDIFFNISVWEPVRFDKNYQHPVSPNDIGVMMMNPEEGVDDLSWAVPFSVSMHNSSYPNGVDVEIPFGLYSRNMDNNTDTAGVVYDAKTGNGEISDYEVDWNWYDQKIERGLARSYLMSWYLHEFDDGAEKSGEYKWLTTTIPWRETEWWHGYFVIIDASKTSALPDGGDLSSSVIIDFGGSTGVMCIANLDKNSEGELVFVD